MKHKIIEEIKKSIKSKYNIYDDTKISIEKPKNKDHGDISTNIALILAKKVKKNPLEICDELKNELSSSSIFDSIEIAKPGFINFKLSISSLTDSLKNINKSARNIKNLKLIKEEGANIYDLFKYKNVIITSSSAKKIQVRVLNEKN